MKKTLKRLAAGLAVMAFAATAGIQAGSMWRLGRTYDAPLKNFDMTRFGFSPEEARRRAATFMCTGCHGAAGNVVFEDKAVAMLVAPNLFRVAASYSDSQLERLLRRGVKKDGTGVIAMPSANFASLADEDVAAIIIWLRGLEERPDAEPNATTFGPLGRIALALGKVPFDADDIPELLPPERRPADFGPYFVQATCADCHELDREHDDGFGMVTPPLRVVTKGYSFQEFNHLLDSGEGAGGRDLGIMSKVAGEDFSHLAEEERKAVYTYLTGPGE